MPSRTLMQTPDTPPRILGIHPIPLLLIIGSIVAFLVANVGPMIMG